MGFLMAILDRRFLTVSFLVLVASPPQGGQGTGEQEAAPKFSTFMLKDGGSLEAAVLKIDGERVRLRVAVRGGGHAETWKDLADFSKLSQFIMRRDSVPEGDCEACLKLARWATDQGLMQQGRQALRQAVAMAEEATFTPERRSAMVESALTVVEDIFRWMIRNGKASQARSGLESILIRHPDKLTEAQKMRLHDLIESEVSALAAAKAGRKRARDDQQQSAQTERKLASLKKRLDQGKAARRKGLLSSKYFSKANASFERATRHFQAVIKSADSIIQKSGNDPELVARASSMRKEADQYWKSAMLSSASLKLTRGHYNAAMEKVNRILADHPSDPQAMRMRSRIEIAANEWDIWR